MKIRHNRLKIKAGMVISALFILFALWALDSHDQEFFVFFFFIYGILLLFLNVLRIKRPYIEIINGSKIVVHNIIKRKFEISKINEVKKTFGDFELTIADKKVKLYKDFVHKEDLAIFEEYFDKLNHSLTENN